MALRFYRALARVVVFVSVVLGFAPSLSQANVSACAHPAIVDQGRECKPLHTDPWAYGAPGTYDHAAPRTPDVATVEAQYWAHAKDGVPNACSWEWSGSYGVWPPLFGHENLQFMEGAHAVCGVSS